MIRIRTRRGVRPGGRARAALVLPVPPEWVADGLCAQTDPELFFPEKGASTRSARSVCAACPVRAACLEYALTNNELVGVWGGTSVQERIALRRERRDQERRAAA